MLRGARNTSALHRASPAQSCASRQTFAFGLLAAEAEDGYEEGYEEAMKMATANPTQACVQTPCPGSVCSQD